MRWDTSLGLLLVGLVGCRSNLGAGVTARAEGLPAPEPAGVAAAPELAGPAIELVKLPAPGERVAVPGFDGATAWLNVDHPLTLAELRGRVLVVDFWTSCCINCLQTLPTLRALEERFRGQPVTVIGVHSPKFDEEREADRLRDILRDNRVEHPVAVDGTMAVWKRWGVEGWPTVAVLDVDGKAVWAGSGEPDGQELNRIVASALAEGRAAGKLARGALRGLAAEKDGSGALRYPGKVLALASGGAAIADTGHDRVVLLDRDGAVEAVVGSGLAGALDGGYGAASFDRPEGMAELGDDLYVADTQNNLLRRIDRKARAVTTVAGTGALGERKLPADEQPGRSAALRSPWDVLAARGQLYVALAGSHQIAAFDPKRGTIRAFAGNGHEARADGSLLDASFAQPSALATDGKEIFVLDSETSSVRAIDPAAGQVRTVVGDDLFVFGDRDGDRATARLQHPIGMAYADGALWVADSYNSKLKRVDPRTGATRTVLGGADRKDLSEPAGVSAGQGALLIADTNHHRVLRLPLAPGAAPRPLALGGLTAPATGVALASAPSKVTVDPTDPVAALGTVHLAPGKPSALRVRWSAPAGTGVNLDAPFRLVWTDAQGLARLPDATRARGAAVVDGFEVPVEPAAGAATASLTGVLDLVVCDVATHRACVPVRRTLKASFVVEPGATPAPVTVALPDAR